LLLTVYGAVLESLNHFPPVWCGEFADICVGFLLEVLKQVDLLNLLEPICQSGSFACAICRTHFSGAVGADCYFHIAGFHGFLSDLG
jgi:hypothetical protein